MRATIILLLLVAVLAASSLAAPRGGKKKGAAASTGNASSASDPGTGTRGGKKGGASTDVERFRRDTEGVGNSSASLQGRTKGQARSGKGKAEGRARSNRPARDLDSVLAAGSSMVASMGNAASSALERVGNMTKDATRQVRNFTRAAAASVRRERDIQLQPFLSGSSGKDAQHNEPSVHVSASVSAKSDQAMGSSSIASSTPIVSTPQIKYQYVNDSSIVIIGGGNDSLWTSPGIIGGANATVQILPFNMSSSVMEPMISDDLSSVFQGIAEVVGERLNVLINNVADAIAKFVSRLGQNTGK